MKKSSDSEGGEDARMERRKDRPEEVRAACRLMEQRAQYNPPGGRLAVYTVSKAKARRSGQSSISHHPRRIYIPTRPPSSVHPRPIARGTSSRRTRRVVAMRGGGGGGCISGIYPPLILRPGRLAGGVGSTLAMPRCCTERLVERLALAHQYHPSHIQRVAL